MEHIMTRVTIKVAALRLGVSELTIRRRLHTGLLVGHQEPTPQGFVWWVELTDDEPEPSTGFSHTEEATSEVLALRELVATLQAQVRTQGEELEARRREVQELHVLLQQTQAALPSGQPRPWWKFWY